MPYANPEVQRAYQRDWKRRRRAEWISKNGPCVRCGSWVDLEVDHVDPNEKVDHRVWSWSAERRASELAKCEVLCHPCHVEKGDGVRRGNDHPMAVLTADQVEEIRARRRAGAAVADLAAEFGVSTSAIYKIIQGRHWKYGPVAHVGRAPAPQAGGARIVTGQVH